jgi:hypothetical protein
MIFLIIYSVYIANSAIPAFHTETHTSPLLHDRNYGMVYCIGYIGKSRKFELIYYAKRYFRHWISEG